VHEVLLAHFSVPKLTRLAVLTLLADKILHGAVSSFHVHTDKSHEPLCSRDHTGVGMFYKIKPALNLMETFLLNCSIIFENSYLSEFSTD